MPSRIQWTVIAVLVLLVGVPALPQGIGYVAGRTLTMLAVAYIGVRAYNEFQRGRVTT